jgi:hypothetical protein
MAFFVCSLQSLLDCQAARDTGSRAKLRFRVEPPTFILQGAERVSRRRRAATGAVTALGVAVSFPGPSE